MIRIRVRPSYGGLGYGGMGGLGGFGVRGRFGAGLALQHEKRQSAMRLKYERALWNERLQNVKLQTALQYGGIGAAGLGVGALGVGAMSPMGVGGAYYGALNTPYMNPAMNFSGNSFFGGLGLGGLFGSMF